MPREDLLFYPPTMLMTGILTISICNQTLYKAFKRAQVDSSLNAHQLISEKSSSAAITAHPKGARYYSVGEPRLEQLMK
jgi:hypothetical protein